MVNVIHHLSKVSENKVQVLHYNVKITNLSCVQTENVLEIKTIVNLNYLVLIMVSDVLTKHVNQLKANVMHNQKFAHHLYQFYAKVDNVLFQLLNAKKLKI